MGKQPWADHDTIPLLTNAGVYISINMSSVYTLNVMKILIRNNKSFLVKIVYFVKVFFYQQILSQADIQNSTYTELSIIK